jgi:4-hydroxy-tetrahydrodipicolinate synthase
MLQSLSGVVVTNVTPFTESLEIDEPALRALYRFIASHKGIGGMLCNAHAGEGSALSREEKKRCIRLAREEVGGRMPVLACVEAYGTADVIALIRDAQEAGAEAVMVCPPPIYSWRAARSPEVAIEFFRAISKATDIPLIVFQYYDGAQHSYAHDTLIQILRENEKVIAVKLALGDNMARYLRDAWAIRALPRPISIMPASGYLLFSHCMIEADGAITGFANFAPAEVVALLDAIKADDLPRARRIEAELRPLALAIESEPFFYMHDRYKEATVMLGKIPSARVRPPALEIGDRERASLRQAMVDSGLLPAAERRLKTSAVGD